MGSERHLLSIEETAEHLGVSVSQVHRLSRRQLLTAHYPYGPKGGKHFHADDVYTLRDLRAEGDGLLQKLPQLALRAVISSRRTEKQMEELLEMLGVVSTPLSTSRGAVLSLYFLAESLVKQPPAKDDPNALTWSKILIGITEEYFEAVAAHTGDPEPWRVFLAAGQKTVERANSYRTKAYAEYARRNLRQTAYFYVRGAHGAHQASRLFPGERYSGRLIQRLLPA